MSSVSPRHLPILLLLFPVSLFSSDTFLLQHFSCFCISTGPPVQRKMDKVYSSVDFGSSTVFRNHRLLVSFLFPLLCLVWNLERGPRGAVCDIPTQCLQKRSSMPSLVSLISKFKDIGVITLLHFRQNESAN